LVQRAFDLTGAGRAPIKGTGFGEQKRKNRRKKFDSVPALRARAVQGSACRGMLF
jgi:hypothetical protein